MRLQLTLRSIIIAILLASLTIAAGCGSNGNGNKETNATAGNDSGGNVTNDNHPSDHNPIVTIEMEDGQQIKIELYPEVAPNTVNNFISLIHKGFYDGLIFHRVIAGFMIQGGDPDGNGTGGPGYFIKGEFSSNRVVNDLKHTRGVISMARADHPDTAGSQFFIMVADVPGLDGLYAAFGKVTEGMDTVDEIVMLPTGNSDRPQQPPKMKKVTVDTHGTTYAEPETIR